MVVGQCLEDIEGNPLASVEGGSGSQGGTGFLNIRRSEESGISQYLVKVIIEAYFLCESRCLPWL